MTTTRRFRVSDRAPLGTRAQAERRLADAVAGQRDALLDVLEALVYGDPDAVALLRWQLRVPLAAARVTQQLEQEQRP